jgi:hypothetical protein
MILLLMLVAVGLFCAVQFREHLFDLMTVEHEHSHEEGEVPVEL